MSETTQLKAHTGTAAIVHRREFLCLAPSAALASSMPLGINSSRPSGNSVSISEALAALWDHSGEGSGSIIKPSTAERLPRSMESAISWKAKSRSGTAMAKTR